MNEITNAIISFLESTLNNDILTIIIIALFPIIELRGAIPVAFKLGLEWYEALFFSWLGSSLVVPILLLLLRPILNAMKRTKGFKSFAHAIESNFEGKAAKIKSKAAEAQSERRALWKKLIGVFAFVAVPLPLTGVWTGSAVAAFLGLSFWQALPAVLLGNLTAGIIMTVLSVCFKAYVDTILSVFLIIVLIVVVFYIIMMIVRMSKNKKARAKEENTVDAIEGTSVVANGEDDSTEVETNMVDDNAEVDSIADIDNIETDNLGEDGDKRPDDTGAEDSSTDDDITK